MLDIGWWELLLLAVLAVIVVGPKDLPRMMVTVGRYVARLRSMAAEFQRGFEDIARQTELEDLKKEIDRAGQGDILSSPPPIRPDDTDDDNSRPAVSSASGSPASAGAPAINPAPAPKTGDAS